MGIVIAVVGGSGGVGASSFAAVLAAEAGAGLLLDLDVTGGGIDVTLGIEQVPGARWSGLRLAGGRLDPAALVGGLPRWGGALPVLAADVTAIEAEAVQQVLEVAQAAAPLVVDLPRGNCPERAAALMHCTFVVLLARTDVAGLVGAHAVATTLPELPIGLVCRRGEVSVHDAEQLVGRPAVGELPALDRRRLVLNSHHRPQAMARVAAGVLAGIRNPGAPPVVPAA